MINALRTEIMNVLKDFKTAVVCGKINSIFKHLHVLGKEATSLRKTARLSRFASLPRT